MTGPHIIDFQLDLIPWLQEQIALDETDPDVTPRMLDEIRSKRKILSMCETVLNGTGWKAHAQLTLRWMTYPYRERRGFDPEWRQWP